MKKLFLTAALSVLIPWISDARCMYARTAYDVASCKPLPKDKTPAYDMTPSTPALPGLEEPETAPLDEVTCDCTYVLDGSNPLCDSDREQEFSQTYPQEPSAPVCKRAKSVCAAVCPKTLY